MPSTTLRTDDAVPGRSHQLLRGILAGVLGLSLTLLQFACTHPTLGKPVFLGASATAGVGAATSSADGDPLPVDMAVVYDAVVVAPHEKARRLGDGLFYQRPEGAAGDQIEAAAQEPASIVFAVDWLFWPAYAPVPSNVTSATDAGEHRVERVKLALSQLATYDGSQTPLVVGDVPTLDRHARHAALPGRGGLASADGASSSTATEPSNEANGRPAPATLLAINRCIADWAAQRPWVFVLPLGEFMAGTRVTPDGSPLLQEDGVHPTAAGLLFIVQESMRRLSAAGLVKDGDWRADLADTAPALASAAKRSLDTPSAGWLDKAAVYLAYRELGDALEHAPPDCARASRAAARLFEMAPRLDADPTGMGFGAMFAAEAARTCMEACPDTVAQVRRCVERLGFDIRRRAPNPFRLSLWTELALVLGAEEEVVQRALSLSRESTANLEDYDDTLDRVEHLLREAPAADPGAGAEAGPSRRAKIVALRGGPDALLERGQRALSSLGDVEPNLAPLGAAEVAAGRPPRIAYPPSSPAASWNGKMEHVFFMVGTLIDDLNAAGRSGDAASMDAARSLAAALDARLGVVGRGASIGRLPSLASRLSAPDDEVPWEFVAWGTLDDEVQRRWLSGAEAASEEDVLGESNMRLRRLFSSRNTLQALLDLTPTHVVGQVGDFDAASGTLTIVDGEALVTESSASATPAERDLSSHQARPTDLRRQSIRAGVKHWSSTDIADCRDLESLEQGLWRAACAAGLDVARPVPVRVEAEFDELRLRVDRAVALPASTGDVDTSTPTPNIGPPIHAPTEPARFAVGPRRALLVGFLAPWALGTIVRPDRASRLHAVWTDDAGRRHTAEVEGLGGGRRIVLHLPAPTMAP